MPLKIWKIKKIQQDEKVIFFKQKLDLLFKKNQNPGKFPEKGIASRKTTVKKTRRNLKCPKLSK